VLPTSICATLMLPSLARPAPSASRRAAALASAGMWLQQRQVCNPSRHLRLPPAAYKQQHAQQAALDWGGPLPDQVRCRNKQPQCCNYPASMK
jgi:hypothetical protein